MPEKMNFEEALDKLQDIVRQLEQDELPLEEALKAFEEGIKISRYCTKVLDDAEKRLIKLTPGGNGKAVLTGFEQEPGK